MAQGFIDADRSPRANFISKSPNFYQTLRVDRDYLRRGGGTTSSTISTELLMDLTRHRYSNRSP